MLNASRLAQAWGIDLKSFVFPGNLAGNLACLKKAGFTNYRYHNRYELGLPEQDQYGLWRIPGGLCWEKPSGWTEDSWINELQRSVN